MLVYEHFVPLPLDNLKGQETHSLYFTFRLKVLVTVRDN